MWTFCHRLLALRRLDLCTVNILSIRVSNVVKSVNHGFTYPEALSTPHQVHLQP